MEHRLCCQISEQDGMLRVKDVLEKKMGLTRRQISRLKYIPDGITLNHRQVRTDALAHPGDTVCAALDLGRRFIPTSDDFTRIPLDILGGTRRLDRPGQAFRHDASPYAWALL